MTSVLAVLIIVLLALLAVQLGTNALVLTGMSLPAARFQAISAFFGTGFTTKEAEMVVNHPVRRKIIAHLIVAGNIGLTSAMATVIVTFVQRSEDPLEKNIGFVVILVLSALALGMLFKLPIVKGPIDLLQRRLLESAGKLRAVDYEVLLKVKHGYCVSDLEISEGHSLAGRALQESRPSDHGIVVLGIYHKGGRFEGAPNKRAVIAAGDTIMVYGSEEAVDELVQGNPNPRDSLLKIDERAEEVE